MGSQLVQKQHYVPQRYLRYFAERFKKKNRDIFRFNVFDKEKASMRENQNIGDLASERFFYDVDFELLKKEAQEEGIEIEPEFNELLNEVDKQEMEHTFAKKVETTMFDPIAQIVTLYTMTQESICSNIYVIPENKRAVIAYYLTLQYLRTKEFREKIVQIHERGGKLLMKKTLKGKVSKNFLDNVELKLKESRINLIHNEILLDTKNIEEISLILLGHIWFIAVNKTDEFFYTSDNPLVINGHLREHGLKCKGVEIIFPITPRIALVMREREYFKNDLFLYNRFFHVSKEYVEYCNKLQVLQSYRYVFSKHKNFYIAEELIRKHPELRELNRDRYLMG